MGAAAYALSPPLRVEDARERACGGERERTERAVNLRDGGPEGMP
jgi:hypothetical protein